MPSNVLDHKPSARLAAPAADAGEAAAWQAILALRRRARVGILGPSELEIAGARVLIEPTGAWRAAPEEALSPAVAALLDLFLPLALAPYRRGFVLAHLAQSLDGRIATLGGASQWLTGPEDLRHTHRLRALADAVIVGAATVRQDDPRLTVRLCAGDQPVRVVLDGSFALAEERHVFHDGAAPTLVLAAADRVPAGARLGDAEIVLVPREGEYLSPQAIRAVLARRGLHWLFVEGGGVTVSRFLAAGALDRLQIAVAPVILGSGRPGLGLPEISDLAGALRPRMRRFPLGADTLVECIFHE